MSDSSRIARRRIAAREEGSAAYQQRRKEISEAAVKVFNRLGFTAASIGDVADELKIDRASLYYYIGSKEELFDEVLREVIENNLSLASRIQASTAKPKEKLREVIKALMQSYGDNYPLLYIYVRENLSQVSDRRTAWSNQMRKLNRQTEDAIIAIVEEGFADGSLRRVGTAKIVTYGILGVLGWTNRWFKPGRSEMSAAEIGEVYANLILQGLEAPPAPKAAKKTARKR